MNIARRVVSVASISLAIVSFSFSFLYAASPLTTNRNAWYLPRKAATPLTALKINGISYMRNEAGQVVRGSGSVSNGGVDFMPNNGTVSNGGVDFMPNNGTVSNGGVDF